MTKRTFKRVSEAGEETIVGILYAGQENIEELLELTGKAPEWDKFFASMDDYKAYLAQHNDVFKIFYDNGVVVEVEPGEWVFKNTDNGAIFAADPSRLHKANFIEVTE